MSNETKRDNLIRVIWRDDEGRRWTGYLEVDREVHNQYLVTALDEAKPQRTVYLTSAAEDCQSMKQAHGA